MLVTGTATVGIPARRGRIRTANCEAVAVAGSPRVAVIVACVKPPCAEDGDVEGSNSTTWAETKVVPLAKSRIGTSKDTNRVCMESGPIVSSFEDGNGARLGPGLALLLVLPPASANRTGHNQ